MVVRQANLADAHEIADLHVKSWQGAYRGLLPDEFLANLSVERRTRMWTQILADPTVDVLIALDLDPGIVGFVSLQESRDSDASDRTGEITAIYALPGKWGHGFGRALMDATLGRARQRNFRLVTLWVLDSNERARRFYEKAGFVTDGAAKTETLAGPIVLEEIRYTIDLG